MNDTLRALLPWILVGGGALATLLLLCAARVHGAVAAGAAASVALAVVSLPAAVRAPPDAAGPLLAVDGFTVYFAGLLLLATLAVIWLAHGYLERLAEQREEFYPVLLLGTLGAMTLAASRHLAALFLGLELLSVALFVLAAYLRDRRTSLEAGFKYLVLASVSSAFLVLAIALLYAATGTLDVPSIAAALPGVDAAERALAVAGLALLLVAAGFKLALVPFHLWAPDVYEGAPAPAAAYLASVSKAAMLAVVVRLFLLVRDPPADAALYVVGSLAVASMLAGNLLALLETRIKRLLAYSSIAHLGYAVLALLASGPAAAQAAAFYMTAYVATVLAAFGVVAVLEPETGDAPTIDAYRGLLWRRPLLATILMAAMLSLAGIPLTAGFVGKFLLLAAGVEAELWIPVFALVLGSAIGAFYYLRVVVALFSRSDAAEPAHAHVPTEAPLSETTAAPRLQLEHGRLGNALPMPRIPLGASLVLGVLVLVVVWLGTWPAPLLRLIESSLRAGT